MGALLSTYRSSSQTGEGRVGEALAGYAVSDRLPMDAQLVSLAKEDAGRALELLYNAHRRRIYTFLLRLARTNEAADDLTQETFVKALRGIARLESDQKLLPWLYRIATNTAIDHARRRNRFAWVPWVALRGARDEPHGDDGHAAVPERDEIGTILAALPPENAAALLLHSVEGYTYAEIARIQGCTLPAVRSRIARARAAFKDRYPIR